MDNAIDSISLARKAKEEKKEIETQEDVESTVKDSLEEEVSKLSKREEKSLIEQKKDKVRQDRAKQQAQIERQRKRKSFLAKMLTLNTYKDWIQSLEPLIEVISKDAVFLLMIISILYSFYIIVTMNAANFDWLFILFKIIGSSIITILSFVLLNNWNENVELEKSEEE